uniref:Uncharacterized protein n=1 Tax=Arundo donax TaxID=35708 RepID=A0A0A9EXM6_ARUDO
MQLPMVDGCARLMDGGWSAQIVAARGRMAERPAKGVHGVRRRRLRD